ncbi:TadE/TadG family type IV pilus assembly protein [Nocardioides maradonensis]
MAVRQRGTSAVEFVIVAPVFLLLVFTIIEAGLYFHARDTAQTSAREGVSALRLAGTNADPGSYRAYAEQIATQFATQIGDLTHVTSVATIDQHSGRVSVRVEGDVVLPVGGTMHISQTSSATLEQWLPDLRNPS